ncbi:MAG: hypothetical protein Q9M36_06195 [Sulfurovum sp.]|nr:hypothetical protein [Sulfurovum sp.]
MYKILRLCTLLITLPSLLLSQELEPMDIYEQMSKALHGEWKLSAQEKQIDTTGAYKNKLVLPLLGTEITALSYKTVGFGSSLQEDLLPDTKKQMVTMYHCDDYIDCNQLQATHYCTKMNQPQFILDIKHSTKDKIIFNCDMQTALCQSDEDHIHHIILEFSNKGQHLKTSYLGWTKQKPNNKHSIYHFDKK